MIIKKLLIKTFAFVLTVVLAAGSLPALYALPEGTAEAESYSFDGKNVIIAVIGDGFGGYDKCLVGDKCLVSDKFFVGDKYFAPDKDFSGPLTKASLRELAPSLEGEGSYINARFPYAWDYAESDGVISAGAAGDDEGMTLCDIIMSEAPESQLLLMKIYGYDEKNKKGVKYGVNYEAACSALRDAFTLGASVILLDIEKFAGSADGGDLPSDMAKLLAEAEERGISVVCAAGGDGMLHNQSYYQRFYGINMPAAPYPDYGTVSSPASISSVTAAAGSESPFFTSPCVRFGGGQAAPYTDTSADYNIGGGVSFAEVFDSKTLEYVPVGGTGTADDCAAADLKGKIALIERGDLTFTEKINNAADRGAAGVIIYDNIEDNPLTVYMQIEGAAVPAIFIPRKYGLMMKSGSDKTVSVKNGDTETFRNEKGGEITSFSSRGSASSLEIKPELTAVAGDRNIKLFSGGEIKERTGSDIRYSAAEIAGKTAALAGYFNSEPKAGASYLKLLMMNAAVPSKNKDGVEFSPRAQGAGVIGDVFAAANPDSLLYSAKGEGKITLGDRLRASYTVKFTIENTCGKMMSYSLSATAAGDEYAYFMVTDQGLAFPASDKSEAEPSLPAFVTGEPKAFSQAVITLGDAGRQKNINSHSEDFTAARITLEAGERREITLMCSLGPNEAAQCSSVFENGYYIDGFVTAESADGGVSSIPYSGFIGNFGALRAADTPLYDGPSYYDLTYMYSELKNGALSSEVRLGSNLFSDFASVIYDGSKIAFSPNGDGYADTLSLAFTLLRNVSDVKFKISDRVGNEIFTLYAKEDLKKTRADDKGAGKYLLPVWDGRASDNSSYVYPDGEYTLTAYITPFGGAPQTFYIPFAVDTAAPALDSYKLDGGALKVKVSDNIAIQYMRLYESSSSSDDGAYYSSVVYAAGAESDTHAFDISGVRSRYLYLEIVDYAFNSSLIRIDTEAAG